MLRERSDTLWGGDAFVLHQANLLNISTRLSISSNKEEKAGVVTHLYITGSESWVITDILASGQSFKNTDGFRLDVFGFLLILLNMAVQA